MTNFFLNKIDEINALSRRGRAKYFSPFLSTLDRFGLTADQLSGLKILVAFIAMAISSYHLYLALIIFLFALAIDTLDGALARHQGTATDRGGFIDTLGDLAVHLLIVLGLIISNFADVMYLAFYLVVLTLLFCLSIFYSYDKSSNGWPFHLMPRLTYFKLFFYLSLLLALANISSYDFFNLAVLFLDIVLIAFFFYYLVLFIGRQ